jgi:MFS family permease
MTTTTVAPTAKRNVLLVFAGLMVAMLLASLDQTIFSTALPTIVGQLDGVSHMLWVTTAYILASTIVMPVYGKLGDLIGRKSPSSSSPSRSSSPDPSSAASPTR